MKRFLPIILIVIIAGLLVVIGRLLTEKPKISAHTVIKEVLPIGEYASLAYHYTSVVKDENFKDFKGHKIPLTTRKFIFSYDGKMKLGIDGTRIRAEEVAGLLVIRITLPPVRILSHEIMDGTAEVFDQSQTIFNQTDIGDSFKSTDARKREMEQKVMASSAVNEAKTSAEQQLGALLRSLPVIRDTYKVIFVWDEQEQP